MLRGRNVVAKHLQTIDALVFLSGFVGTYLFIRLCLNHLVFVGICRDLSRSVGITWDLSGFIGKLSGFVALCRDLPGFDGMRCLVVVAGWAAAAARL